MLYLQGDGDEDVGADVADVEQTALRGVSQRFKTHGWQGAYLGTRVAASKLLVGLALST